MLVLTQVAWSDLRHVFGDRLFEGGQQAASDCAAIAGHFFPDDRTHRINVRLYDFKRFIVGTAIWQRRHIQHFAENGDQRIAEGAALTAQFMGQQVDL